MEQAGTRLAEVWILALIRRFFCRQQQGFGIRGIPLPTTPLKGGVW